MSLLHLLSDVILWTAIGFFILGALVIISNKVIKRRRRRVS
jgi:hypothetical protein